MHVVFNASSTMGNKTGVGRYADELLRHLQAKMAPDELFAYPHHWVRQLRLRRGSNTAPPPVAETTEPPRRRFPSPRRALISLLRPMGHALLWGYDRAVLRPGAFDLYHEPNFIPFEYRVPTVVSLHDLSVVLHPEWHPAHRVAFYEANFPRTLRQAAHFITGTRQVRREMMDLLGIPGDKITVTQYGMRGDLRPMSASEVEPVLQRLGLPRNYLLHLGTIEPRKNLLRLMRAYVDLPSALRSRHPLVLAGAWGWRIDDEVEYYHSTAKHHGVIQVGFLPDADLPAVYNGARALVFPTLYEGFGFPTIEMMGCGGAVLASTAGAVAEVVGPHAELIAPDDIEGWRDAMRRLLTDEDWSRNLRQGVMDHARQFTWERTADETLGVYRTMIELGRSQPARAAAA